MSLIEGYLQVGHGFDFRIGRQEITVGEKRLVGSSGWDHKNLAAYDGLRFMTRVSHSALDLFAVEVAEAPKSRRGSEGRHHGMPRARGWSRHHLGTAAFVTSSLRTRSVRVRAPILLFPSSTSVVSCMA